MQFNSVKLQSFLLIGIVTNILILFQNFLSLLVCLKSNIWIEYLLITCVIAYLQILQTTTAVFFFFHVVSKKFNSVALKGRFLLIFSQMKFAMLSDQQEVSRKSVVWYSLVDMISMKTEHLFSWDSLRWEENIFRT